MNAKMLQKDRERLQKTAKDRRRTNEIQKKRSQSNQLKYFVMTACLNNLLIKYVSAQIL